MSYSQTYIFNFVGPIKKSMDWRLHCKCTCTKKQGLELPIPIVYPLYSNKQLKFQRIKKLKLLNFEF